LQYLLKVHKVANSTNLYSHMPTTHTYTAGTVHAYLTSVPIYQSTKWKIFLCSIMMGQN